MFALSSTSQIDSNPYILSFTDLGQLNGFRNDHLASCQLHYRNFHLSQVDPFKLLSAEQAFCSSRAELTTSTTKMIPNYKMSLIRIIQVNINFSLL